MRIIILQAGDDFVNLHRNTCNIFGTKAKMLGGVRFDFDHRTSAPKRHLMRRVVTWVNSWSRSDVKIMILPGGTLTQLLTRKVKERCIFSELMFPPYKEPHVALTRFSQKIRV